jgi:hypothetical protein
MINECQDCKAIREYPSGKCIDACPRCGGKKILHFTPPATQELRDKMVIDMITRFID